MAAVRAATLEDPTLRNPPTALNLFTVGISITSNRLFDDFTAFYYTIEERIESPLSVDRPNYRPFELPYFVRYYISFVIAIRCSILVLRRKGRKLIELGFVASR